MQSIAGGDAGRAESPLGVGPSRSASPAARAAPPAQLANLLELQPQCVVLLLQLLESPV